jgi:hypothetical protein
VVTDTDLEGLMAVPVEVNTKLLSVGNQLERVFSWLVSSLLILETPQIFRAERFIAVAAFILLLDEFDFVSGDHIVLSTLETEKSLIDMTVLIRIFLHDCTYEVLGVVAFLVITRHSACRSQGSGADDLGIRFSQFVLETKIID